MFDFATFGVMLWIFHAGPELFRTGWFVESLATQTLVVFAVHTRRVPFFRSRPSRPLLLAVLVVVSVGAILPETPLSGPLRFQPLPGGFFLALVILVTCYLVLIDAGKRWFYRASTTPSATRARPPGHRTNRRASLQYRAEVSRGDN